MFRKLKFSFLEKYKEYGVIFVRLMVGFHLIYGTQDNVLSYQRMQEFASFLAARNVPFPLFSAFLSVYAQLICGILFVAGAFTRFAGVVMIINFICAIIIAHRHDAYPNKFGALMMLAAACFFFLQVPANYLWMARSKSADSFGRAPVADHMRASPRGAAPGLRIRSSSRKSLRGRLASKVGISLE